MPITPQQRALMIQEHVDHLNELLRKAFEEEIDVAVRVDQQEFEATTLSGSRRKYATAPVQIEIECSTPIIPRR